MMQEENRFFRFIWRLNGILLALVAIVAIGALSTSAIDSWIMRHRQPDTPEGNFAPVPKGAEQNYTYRLDAQPDAAALPHEQILALRRWSGAPASYGLMLKEMDASGSSFAHYTDAVNLLAVSTKNGESHWLFDGYQRAVVDQQSIYAGGPQIPALGKSQAEPIALVIRTVDKDTNGDGQFDYRDGWSLYFYRSGETKAVKFFQADYILSMQEVEGGDFFVVYEKGKSAIAATFSVPDFKIKSEQKLPDVPQ